MGSCWSLEDFTAVLTDNTKSREQKAVCLAAIRLYDDTQLSLDLAKDAALIRESMSETKEAAKEAHRAIDNNTKAIIQLQSFLERRNNAWEETWTSAN